MDCASSCSRIRLSRSCLPTVACCGLMKPLRSAFISASMRETGAPSFDEPTASTSRMLPLVSMMSTVCDVHRARKLEEFW